METECSLPLAFNPAAALAAFVADNRAAGRDKLTIVSSGAALDASGCGSSSSSPSRSARRATASCRSSSSRTTCRPATAPTARSSSCGSRATSVSPSGCHASPRWRPVLELVLRRRLRHRGRVRALGACGRAARRAVRGQPVRAAQRRSRQGRDERGARWRACRARARHHDAGRDARSRSPARSLAPGHADSTVANAIGHALAQLRHGDYLAVLAYLPEDEEQLAPLERAVPRVAAALGVAVTLEIGPRYLHSTGQLHKGGPNNGVFLLVTTRDHADLCVPGRDVDAARPARRAGRRATSRRSPARVGASCASSCPMPST